MAQSLFGIEKNTKNGDSDDKNPFYIPNDESKKSKNLYFCRPKIAEHYQFYVDNYHVGETAFDSSGNFIAGS